MKKLIVLLFFVFTFCLVAGCGGIGGGGGGGKNSSDTAPAKTLDLAIVGKLGGAVALNPAFTWKNNYRDESFSVKIVTGEKVVVEKQTKALSFNVDEYLEKNVQYKITVTGAPSGKSQQLEFKTMDMLPDKVFVKLDNPFGNNMVLQRGRDIEISGSGPVATLITVTFGADK